MNREHGGNSDWARRRYGGAARDWIDLSTGINRRPYRIPDIPPESWTALPTAEAAEAVMAAARAAYGTTAPGIALAGAQAAIQICPQLRPAGTVAILSPTYNEHAGSFAAAGWTVKEEQHPGALRGADIAIVVNPNNPDGRQHGPQDLLALAGNVGLLIVDESFGDVTPDLSLCPHLPASNVIVLRSLGKFYGLAGVRLGFAFGPEADIATMRARAGPWAVSGPALAVGRAALEDARWADETRGLLAADAVRLDALASEAGWTPVGGTPLFRLYDVGDASKVQHRLARQHIWTRAFGARPEWLRLGLPGPEPEWDRIAQALTSQPE